MKYKIIKSDSEYDLERQVNLYLSWGYELQGGISMTSHGVSIHFAQAVVKK